MLIPPESGCLILVSPALSWRPASSVVLIPSTTVFRLAQPLAPLLESRHHGNDHPVSVTALPVSGTGTVRCILKVLSIFLNG